MSETLSATAHYLREILAADTHGQVEASPEIIKNLEMASEDVENELCSMCSLTRTIKPISIVSFLLIHSLYSFA